MVQAASLNQQEGRSCLIRCTGGQCRLCYGDPDAVVSERTGRARVLPYTGFTPLKRLSSQKSPAEVLSESDAQGQESDRVIRGIT